VGTGHHHKRILIGLTLVVELISVAPAAAATGNAVSRARIRRPTTLISSRDLDFGTLIRGATAGTVTINAQTGVRTRTGGVVLAGGAPNSAAFAGTGTGNAIVTMSVSAATITLARSGGGATMTLNTLRVRAGAGGQQTLPRNYTLPASGAQTFNFGGRLNVAANQLDGNYSGTFSLTMNYQ
jgi:hypothetical protein